MISKRHKTMVAGFVTTKKGISLVKNENGILTNALDERIRMIKQLGE